MDSSCRQLAQISSQAPRLGCTPFVRVISIPNKLRKPKPQDPCVPQDSLDRALSACYDQHRQFWAPRSQVVMQCETYRLFPMGRAVEKLCNMNALPGYIPPPCGCACTSPAPTEINCSVKRSGKCGPCSTCNTSSGNGCCGQ